MSNGNVIAIDPQHQDLLGIAFESAGEGSGVAAVTRGLAESREPAIAALALPHDDRAAVTRVVLDGEGGGAPYLVATKRLAPGNLWRADGTVVAESFVLVFVVPERELYAAWAP